MHACTRVLSASRHRVEGGTCTSEAVQRRRRRTTADKEARMTSVSDAPMRQFDVWPISRAALSCTFGRDGGTCTEEPEQ
jgi:hypothetical protein